MKTQELKIIGHFERNNTTTNKRFDSRLRSHTLHLYVLNRKQINKVIVPSFIIRDKAWPLYTNKTSISGSLSNIISTRSLPSSYIKCNNGR